MNNVSQHHSTNSMLTGMLEMLNENPGYSYVNLLVMRSLYTKSKNAHHQVSESPISKLFSLMTSFVEKYKEH